MGGIGAAVAPRVEAAGASGDAHGTCEGVAEMAYELAERQRGTSQQGREKKRKQEVPGVPGTLTALVKASQKWRTN